MAPPNTSLTRETQLGFWPLPVLQTFGQRAVLLAWWVAKERVIVLGAGRRNCLIEVFWFQRPGQLNISDSMSVIAVVNFEPLRFGWSGAMFPGSRSTTVTTPA